VARRRRLELQDQPLGQIAAELGELTLAGIDPVEKPTLSFHVLRAQDLVALDVRCFRCAVVKGTDSKPSEIVRSGDGAWLEVRLSFQHVGERAFYRVESEVPESPLKAADALTLADDATTEPPKVPPSNGESPTDPDAAPDPPTKARAANGSRLCFDVPDGERIEFTIEGFLAALSRLPLRVSPWATPRPQPTLADIGLVGILTEVPGAALVMSEVGPALVSTARARRALGAESAVTPAADGDAARPVLRAANELRVLRNVVSRESAVDLGRIGPASGGAGGAIDRERVGRGPSWRDLIGDLGRLPRPTQRAPQPPAADQTAIEAPYRLIISPSRQGGFAHATRPVAPASDPGRVELWHTRLGVRAENPETKQVSIDERAAYQRIVRAIWARDLDPRNDEDLYAATDSGADLLEPMRMSLDPRDRGMLVRQTADPTIRGALPKPVDAHRLYLSSLGAWLDLHAEWSAGEIGPYAEQGDPSILAWDHVAPIGRDQYVRVVYPGYLFPFGHVCALVKVTERKVLDEKPPQARLYQRKFLVIGEPVRKYDQRDLPFKQVGLIPLVTPDIDDPLTAAHTIDDFIAVASGLGVAELAAAQEIDADHLFWPVVGAKKFPFTLDCLDHAGDRVKLQAPLLFVAAHLGDANQKALIKAMYGTDALVPASAQAVSVATPDVPGDTTLEAETFTFGGEPGKPGSLSSRPAMASATVVVPATRRLAPKAPSLTIAYAEAFQKDGFGGSNKGQVFAEVVGATAKVVYENTAQAGGLVAPNFPVTGLSKALGPVGDVASVVSGDFKPDKFLEKLGEDLLPKLFGIVSLKDLLAEVTGSLDQAPRFITEALDAPMALIADLPRLIASLQAAAERLEAAAADPLADPAIAAQVTKLKQIRDQAKAAVDTVLAKVEDLQKLTADAALAEVDAALKQPLEKVGDLLGELEDLLKEAPLPPTLRAELERLVSALTPLLTTAAELQKTLDLLTSMVNGLVAGDPAIRARYEWKPGLNNWPDTDSILVFDDPPNAFTLTIEARASAKGDAGVDALAELRAFEIRLVPAVLHILTLRFDRIAFRGGSDRKPEVDVLFKGVEFEGILQFIRTLSEVIPFDGLSDPPYVEVDASGARAGFDLGLPNLSVGVFSLENIGLGLEARTPFLGEAVTVGFNFCTRERPFALTVMMFGGGGFFGLRASPKGLVLFEGSLEFGARVSLDFGVASGSIEAMGGIYYRQEDDTTTLTGYFRLRGEVELLAIASVALTAELSLTYRDKGGGKDEMYGQAKVTLEVEVLFVEYSASFTIERRFGGSAGDPTLAETIDIASNGDSKAWSDYCLAFAEE
jgi:hypothetical protein